LIPEFILIHGSWMGGWCWRAVTETLRQRSARCHTPSLSGLEERDGPSQGAVDLDLHIAEVVATCRSAGVERPLLVGHSYGALVAAGAADALRTEISGLVVIDGFVVEPGQSAFDAYPQVRELLSSCITREHPDYIQPLPVAAFGIRDPRIESELALKLRPMPLATHTTPLKYSRAAQQKLRRTYIRCIDFPVFADTAARVVRDGWHLTEVEAGHMALMTHPTLVADAILAAAT
jgi:pimeloyl-ACP methyl ester carboxylesterase